MGFIYKPTGLDWIIDPDKHLTLNGDGEISGTGAYSTAGYPMIAEKFQTNLPKGNIRRIKARFRYPNVNNSVSIFSINGDTTSNGISRLYLSIYDAWDADYNGYRIFHDSHGHYTTEINPSDVILERVLDNSIASEEVVLYIGGRTVSSWKPIYVSELEFEYV